MDVSVHVERDSSTVRVASLLTHRRRRAESATFSFSTAYGALPGSYALVQH
jgi:hypothetical protein